MLTLIISKLYFNIYLLFPNHLSNTIMTCIICCPCPPPVPPPPQLPGEERLRASRDLGQGTHLRPEVAGELLLRRWLGQGPGRKDICYIRNRFMLTAQGCWRWMTGPILMDFSCSNKQELCKFYVTYCIFIFNQHMFAPVKSQPSVPCSIQSYKAWLWIW